MVDFNALMNGEKSSSTVDPIEIFEELPKTNKVNDLYNVQAEILREWHSSLREERDVVIELNTGGGKTLVGLLMALSIMREKHEGVLYLVENKQLAEQVALQARELGIPAKIYRGRASVDADFDNGKSILIGPYHCLFNGKSVFGLQGSRSCQAIGGIIIDDAHASLDAIRDVFSLTISADGSGGLYKLLLSEFRNAFDDIQRSSAYHEFVEGVGNDIVEIPYWWWVGALERVSDLIRKEWLARADSNDDFSNQLKFSWPLLKDNLRYCQAIVSRKGFTIASLYPNVAEIPSFINAKRRIFMSATITDYGDMIRAYDVRDLTRDCVVAPRTVAGVGRRMILNLDKPIAQDPEYVHLANSLVSIGQGVVRLVSRPGTDATWPSLDYYEPIGHDDVLAAVSELQSGCASRPISFVNRYNGIDLPDDACRMLVLRGLPVGGSDSEALMSMYLKDSELSTRRLAQKIEQGLGRGTRGASDHCVVLLEGDDLTDWIKRDRNRKYFTPALRAQLDVGGEIMETLHTSKDFCEAIKQDLDGDEDWRMFHAGRLAKAVSGDLSNRFGDSYDIAKSERRAFACWTERRYDEACEALVKKANECDGDPCYRGWLLHLASRVAFDAGDADRADELQIAAHSFNNAIPYAPFRMGNELPDWTLAQADAIVSEAGGGSTTLLKCFDRDTANLIAEVGHKEFEISLLHLGRYLGFESGRADDNGVGPDVYWITPDGVGLVLEAKNEKKADAPLHKAEAGQLRTAKDWLVQKNPDIDVVPVSVHPSSVADRSASAANLRVLSLESLSELKEATRRLLVGIARGLSGEDSSAIAKGILDESLGGRAIVNKYTKPFEDAK